MTHSRAARRFLGMNAAFSGLNGLMALVAAGMLAPILIEFPENWMPLALRLMGLGLIGFSALLVFLARNRFVTRAAVNEIVLLDTIWVVGSVVLIAFFGDLLTTPGLLIVTAVAIVVAFFAIAQFASAAKITKPVPIAEVTMRDGKLYASVKRTVKAPTETVWDVMTDHPAYADVASNIAKVEVMSGDGLGMKRRCYGPKGENWEETCDVFEPGKSFGFRIHTEAEDYPYPIAELSGRWTVEQHPLGSEFDIQIIAEPKGNPVARWLFSAIAKQQFKGVLIDLADGWATRMESEAKA
ncbi:SRPBCC family protein [uncultured Tateyamaria sp.]|uniref:SRPBCC family protein n=1 Tax=uncultured Tateyamaria sp. TaxID=455651 RepID=UPI00260D8CB8|nr:SRPBCC family protein [uncultured Tateyamaria sp.]